MAFSLLKKDDHTLARLGRYDTAHGKFAGTVTVDGGHMVVNGDRIQVCAKRNPAELPWKELNVDVVLECTGLFTSKEKASAHLAAGAKKHRSSFRRLRNVCLQCTYQGVSARHQICAGCDEGL